MASTSTTSSSSSRSNLTELKNEIDGLVLVHRHLKNKVEKINKQIEKKRLIYHRLHPFEVWLDEIIDKSYNDRWEANRILQKNTIEDDSFYDKLVTRLNEYIVSIDEIRFSVDTDIHQNAQLIDDAIEKEYDALNRLVRDLALLKNPSKFALGNKRRRRESRFSPILPCSKRRRY